MTTITRAMSELIARSGIMKTLADEDEARRSKQHADLRAKLAASVAQFKRQRSVADAAVAAALAKAADAHKMAVQANNDHVAALDNQSTVHGTFTAIRDSIWKEILTCYPPEIDDFKISLEALRADCPNLYRNVPDPDGPYANPNGTKFRDNRDEVQARVVAISAALEAADRLKFDETVADVPAALASILATIPKA